MGRTRWHILKEEGALTVARRRPVRFDLAVRRRLAATHKRRLAQAIRQDIWRALRDLRGFAPVVRVADCPGGVEVTAGGQVEGALPRAQAEGRIAQVLDCAANQDRWRRWAR